MSPHASAAAAAVGVINQAVAVRGSCSLALSGGSTPVPFHRLLATEFAEQVPWGNVHVFWGDERYVPHSDARSNYGMARRTLLDHVPCPSENIHPMPTSGPSSSDAALEYEHTLRKHFSGGVPRFDLMVLGIGIDGHTASLFPHSPALREKSRWVLAVTAEADVRQRLTLTLPVITRAVHTFVIVTGAEKAAAVELARSARTDPADCPAAALQKSEGEVAWWLDAAAAGH